ncbi:MAG: hypothetical protein ABJO62_00965, partial [Marinobacter alexandrii]
NSEVKQACADGSVAFAHVRVGHRQTLNTEKPQLPRGWGFLLPERKAPKGHFPQKALGVLRG